MYGDYSVPDGDVAAALIRAIRFGYWDEVQALVPVLLDVNTRDGNGDWTPLMYAVHEESFDIVKLLVEAGADVNLRGFFEPEEDFALNLAAYAGNKEIFDYLVPLTLPELRAIAERTLQTPSEQPPQFSLLTPDIRQIQDIPW